MDGENASDRERLWRKFLLHYSSLAFIVNRQPNINLAKPP